MLELWSKRLPALSTRTKLAPLNAAELFIARVPEAIIAVSVNVLAPLKIQEPVPAFKIDKVPPLGLTNAEVILLDVPDPVSVKVDDEPKIAKLPELSKPTQDEPEPSKVAPLAPIVNKRSIDWAVPPVNLRVPPLITRFAASLVD